MARPRTTDAPDVFAIDNALCTLVQLGGSDLHLKVRRPPMMRVDGVLVPIDGAPVLEIQDTEVAVTTMLHDPVKLQELAEEFEVDFSYSRSALVPRVNSLAPGTSHVPA